MDSEFWSFIILAAPICFICIILIMDAAKYNELEAEVFKKLGIKDWKCIPESDDDVIVRSRQAFEKYDKIKYIKDNKEKLEIVKNIIQDRKIFANQLKDFLENNEYKKLPQYEKLENKLKELIEKTNGYNISIEYITYAENSLDYKCLTVTEEDIIKIEQDPSLLMTKSEYNKLCKEKQQEALKQKQHKYYNYVNKNIDYANEYREKLFIKGSVKQLDELITRLYDRTVNSIAKIKTVDSEEWKVIKNIIVGIEKDIKKIVEKNQKINDYYESPEFLKIKETCEVLMSSQREFNEYISEKVESISQLFGSRVTRNETINEDEYQYIRPYKKTITPFTAEVSAAVFASAENNPLEYVVKNFYPDKLMYPHQIQKLHLLIGELATLREAKGIIENYKKEYEQYIGDVPSYIFEEDEAGFYARLGFANINESVLVVEYQFSYTSGGGMAKRTFSIPMNEKNIVELIKLLESKLTMSSFNKEQRALMTVKLRDFIKKRDNFTCCYCGNSTHREPNLLLEIDHIIPISKGGYTTEENLQTLCWKCNRTKSNKIN